MKVTFVSGDDWQGLYIDGELKREGHSLAARDVLELLGVRCDYVTADQQWLEESGDLPRRLSDVVLDESDDVLPF